MSKLAERLEAAVLALVRDGPVKQRLLRAYSDHLERLEADELPARIGEPLARLHEALHRHAPIGTAHSRVKASIRKMSSLEAAEHAAAIVRLHLEVQKAAHRSEPLKVVETSQGPIAASS